MPLTITGDPAGSDRTTRTARLVPGRPHAWHPTRLSGRLLDCSSAVSVTLADASGRRPGHRIWPHIANQAVELGQTVPQAITIASRPPETTSHWEPAVSPAGREAAGP